MGGITANAEGAGNIYNLKQVLKKTVKATKVARGSEGPKFDEAEQLLDENMAEQTKPIDEDDEEEDDASADVVNDIDGQRKKVATEYEAESQSEVESEV